MFKRLRTEEHWGLSLTHTHRFKLDWRIVGRFSPCPLWTRPVSLHITSSGLGACGWASALVSDAIFLSCPSIYTSISGLSLFSRESLFCPFRAALSGHTEESSRIYKYDHTSSLDRHVRDWQRLQHRHDITRVVISCHTWFMVQSRVVPRCLCEI